MILGNIFWFVKLQLGRPINKKPAGSLFTLTRCYTQDPDWYDIVDPMFVHIFDDRFSNHTLMFSKDYAEVHLFHLFIKLRDVNWWFS